LERAVKLNPNNQWTAADMGIGLMFAAQAEAAVVSFNRARDIDPYFEPPWYWPCLGRALTILRQYEDALTAFERAASVSYKGAAYMAGCFARLGDTERSAALTRESLANWPEFTISQFMSREPFKNADDAAHLAESLRMAGLPA
jgi:tetratricopeptide (TPR) repeat protein